jgi:hypothetical protein
LLAHNPVCCTRLIEGRSHNDAWVGCIVWSTTATSSAATIEAFSARLRDQVDLGYLSAELVAVADQTMEPTMISLWLRPPMERSGSSIH